MSDWRERTIHVPTPEEVFREEQESKVPKGWLRAEIERAKARNALVPPHARVTIIRKKP